MTPPEHCHQVDQAINEEVNRRINTITTPPDNTEIDHQPVVEEQPQLVPVDSDSDSDKEVTPTVHLRRVPPRLSKRVNIGYTGKRNGEQSHYTWSLGDQAFHVYQQDNEFITTTDIYSTESRSSSSTRAMDAPSYVTQDDII